MRSTKHEDTVFQIILNIRQGKKNKFNGINFLVPNVETAYKSNVTKALILAV